ncbi:hypothetical protein C1H46_004457 [Malus baccata]|uniref:Transmembrane 9 superfamily member n=1 Tax=Malus baccata TaxID=106549 RepID=A0A540NFT4_MALBA|nr:hypothetical protein C1H46_004457 [Malus baccata]
MGKTMAVGVHCIIALLILSSADLVRSDGSDHRYKEGDFVPLYANKVGPFHNPSETYGYFDLPFCSPDAVKEKGEALGEVLNGDRLVSAPYKLEFLRHKDPEVACKKTLTKEEVGRFRSAVSKDYYFQMYYDDLPTWGFIGKVDKEGEDPSEYKTYLYKHIHFDLYYNKDRVIEVNVRTDPNALVDLSEDKEVDVEFMYTVEWKETTTPFDKRMDKYSQSSSLPPLVNAYELHTVTRPLIDPKYGKMLVELLNQLTEEGVKRLKGDPSDGNWCKRKVNWYNCSNLPTGRRVTSLNLSSRRLTGQFPGAIRSMDELQKIDFHNNCMYGTIPDFLGSLPNLKLLEFVKEQTHWIHTYLSFK